MKKIKNCIFFSDKNFQIKMKIKKTKELPFNNQPKKGVMHTDATNHK